MIGYGLIENKTEDDPDPARELWYCGRKELRSDSSASDGINSSIELDESDLEYVEADPGDTVLLYVEANLKWVACERDLYPSRPGIGLPLDARRALELELDDKIDVWISDADSTDQSDSQESKGARQQSLGDPELAEEDYVVIADEPFKYHYINQNSGAVTECSINFGDADYRTFSDPGDALEECQDCSLRAGTDMTNKELVDWLGEEVGFETNQSDAPGYLNKTQLIALRNHITDLNEQIKQAEQGQAEVEGS